jgi:hypothetical protein
MARTKVIFAPSAKTKTPLGGLIARVPANPE